MTSRCLDGKLQSTSLHTGDFSSEQQDELLKGPSDDSKKSNSTYRLREIHLKTAGDIKVIFHVLEKGCQWQKKTKKETRRKKQLVRKSHFALKHNKSAMNECIALVKLLTTTQKYKD